MLSVDDLTARERIVFVASCQLEQMHSDDPRIPVLYDDEWVDELERLTAIGWLERIEVVRDGESELVGYRLSPEASTAHNVQSLLDGAQEARN